MKVLYTLVSWLWLSSLALAEIKTDFAVTTNYVYRGISISEHGPAVLGGVEYGHSNGVWGGLELATAGSWGTEQNLRVKYMKAASETMNYGMGLTYFDYTEKKGVQNLEVNFIADVDVFKFGFNYTPNYFGTETAATYTSLAVVRPIWPEEYIALSMAIGLSAFANTKKAEQRNYIDVRVAADRAMKDYVFTLFLSDTNRVLLPSHKDANDHAVGMAVRYML